jgi:hypothetical protein
MLSSPNACLIIVRVSVSLFPRFAKNVMMFLCRSRCKIALGLVHWLPRYENTITEHCIVLLQLLYRWQHLSQKLWIMDFVLECKICFYVTMLKLSIWHGCYIYVLENEKLKICTGIIRTKYLETHVEYWKKISVCAECIYKEDLGKCKKQERRFLALIFVTGWVIPWAVVQLED